MLLKNLVQGASVQNAVGPMSQLFQGRLVKSLLRGRGQGAEAAEKLSLQKSRLPFQLTFQFAFQLAF